MLYLVEVLDSICFLEKRLREIFKTADVIDAVSGRLNRLPRQELLKRFNTPESRMVRTGNVAYEREDSSSGTVVHMEERVIELDNS